MVVYVPSVNMSANDKGVFAFEKPRRKLVADAVRLLRRHLAWFERLTNLVRDDVAFVRAPGQGFVLPLGKQKLRIDCAWVTFVCGDKLAVIRFVGIFRVVDTVLQGLREGLTLADVERDDTSGSYSVTSDSIYNCANPLAGGFDEAHELHGEHRQSERTHEERESNHD